MVSKCNESPDILKTTFRKVTGTTKKENINTYIITSLWWGRRILPSTGSTTTVKKETQKTRSYDNLIKTTMYSVCPKMFVYKTKCFEHN